MDGPLELESVRGAIKQVPCPRCGQVGTLNAHGLVYGNGTGPVQRVLRGARFYCSRRRQRQRGCGRTAMVWLADRLPHYSVGTAALWAFLRLLAQAGLSVQAAWEAARTGFSLESARRWARHLRAGLEPLRPWLCRVRGPPPTDQNKSPLSQTVDHLELALGGEDPIKKFQSHFQTSPMLKAWAGGTATEFPS